MMNRKTNPDKTISGRRFGPGGKILLALAGVFAAAALGETALRLGGRGLLLKREKENARALVRNDVIRVLCLGESTTMSEYPRFLEEYLNRAGSDRRFAVIDEGVGGTNTGLILSKLNRHLGEYRPHVVVTMMGVNDEDWSVPLEEGVAPVARALHGLRELRLSKLVRLAWGRVAGKNRALAAPSDSRDSPPAAPPIRPELATVLSRAVEHEMRGEWPKAEARYREALAIEPENEAVLLGSAGVFVHRGRWDAAEELYRRLEKNKPGHEAAALGRAELARHRGRWQEAARLFERAATSTSAGLEGWLQAGVTYRMNGAWNDAERCFRKAAEIDPQNDRAYLGLADVFSERGQQDEAEDHYRKALERNPANAAAYIRLGRIYWDRGERKKAERLFEQARHTGTDDGKVGYELALISRQLTQAGRPARDMFWPGLRESGPVPLARYRPVTVNNYRRLRDIVLDKGILLVCAQYPMRDVSTLKEAVGDRPGVVFVDNGPSFREAVRQDGFGAYFRDAFGGDFGHCTPAGNSLLAANIGRAILSSLEK